MQHLLGSERLGQAVHHHRGIVHRHINTPLVGDNAVDRRTAACLLLDIELQRDQARMHGVSETRILSLLRTAYSQNYVYLIKKPQDQYQVILEIEDAARAHPEDLSRLYIRSDDSKNLVPLRALVTWKTSLGPQAVNHLNQFTSVTLFFNLKPGVSIGDAVAAMLIAL